MTKIGEPIRKIVVIPVKLPEPLKRPERPRPEPIETPEKEPEKVAV